jgi:hypothetical protein
MLRWVFLVVAVVFLTAAATLVSQFLPESEDTSKVAVVEVTGPQPKIVIEGDLEYNFGKMPRFDKASHTWTVKNDGEKPLEVRQHGKTTCSCTAAKLDHGQKTAFDENQKVTMVLQPGESNTIDLEWNTEKDLGENYSQGATFATNDPRKLTFKLTVYGKVYPPVEIYPPQAIQLPRMNNEQTYRAGFAVFSKERPDLKLAKVTSSRPGLIVAEFKPMTAEDAKRLKIEKGYMVTVVIKPGMPLGDFHDELVIVTDHPKQPEVKVTVGGHVDGPISVTPPGLRLRDVVSREGASRDLFLVVRGGKETKFDVLTKPEQLEISIVRDDTATLKGRYRMTVKVPPGTAGGEIGGDIVLKTDHPMAKELKIPVSILIARSATG